VAVAGGAAGGPAANLTREQAELLSHQSEDCLTLNIYVPQQEEGGITSSTLLHVVYVEVDIRSAKTLKS
jgi:hypothetical protein